MKISEPPRTSEPIPEHLMARIESMSIQERAKAACEFNRWQWADAFSDVKPDGWDEMPNSGLVYHRGTKYGHPLSRALIDALRNATPEKEVSRYWNTVMHAATDYGMTDAVFEAWWSRLVNARKSREPK